MHSPPHRENILSPDYDSVGIGVVRGSNGVYWATQDFAHVTPQRSANQAQDLVAQRVQALRRTVHGAPIQRVDDASVQQLACAMGRAGKIDPNKVLALPGVHYAVTYNNSRPEELPASAKNAAQQRSVTKFAVGACEAADEGNPGGTYYVVMAFY